MIVDWTDDVVGAKEFVTWFGHVPSFHDAYLRDFQVLKDGTVTLAVRGFRMTTELDTSGHYVLDKHYLATIVLQGVRRLQFAGFEDGEGILMSLCFAKTPTGSILTTMEACVGIEGEVESRSASLTFVPVMDAGAWLPGEGDAGAD